MFVIVNMPCRVSYVRFICLNDVLPPSEIKSSIFSTLALAPDLRVFEKA